MQRFPRPPRVSGPGLVWPGALALLLALGCAQPPLFDETTADAGGDAPADDGAGGGGGMAPMVEPETLPPAKDPGDMVWRTGTGMSTEALALDPQGNLVLAGTASSPELQGEIAIAKYTRFGVPIWQKTFGGPGQQGALAVAVGRDGTIVATGSFQGLTDFGGVTLNAAGGTDVFVAAYTPDGVLKKAVRFGGAGDEAGMGIVVDRTSGEWIVTGHGTADFKVGANIVVGHFLFRVQNDGTPQWAKAAGRNLVASAPDGSALFVASSGKGLVTRHTPTSGEIEWMSELGKDVHPSAALIDGMGRLLVTGGYYSQLTTMPQPVFSFGKRDAFLVALDGMTGKPLWTKVVLASYGEDSGRAMCADPAGNIYLAGRYFGTAALVPGDIETIEQPFVARHKADGTAQWTRLYKPGGSASSILCEAAGGIVSAGEGWLMQVLP